MKILHIWNTAGVGSIIAKYMDRIHGTESWLVHRRDFEYGLTTFGELWGSGARVFALRCLIEARKYDIIHVHSLEKIVPFLKLIYPKKPIMLHYHGSEIRDQWSIKRKYWDKADLIIVSTPDLLEGAPERAIYLYNPIDTDIFKYIPDLRKPNTALFVLIRKPSSNGNLEWAEKTAKDMDLELTILDRDNAPVPYEELPEYLNQFEYFIDRKKIPSLSKTALEALACGLKVIRWDDEIVEGLPEEHRPENVVICLNTILARK